MLGNCDWWRAWHWHEKFVPRVCQASAGGDLSSGTHHKQDDKKGVLRELVEVNGVGGVWAVERIGVGDLIGR